ncbi:HK97 family phage prohead protease [Marinifilum fragile]|uniref:HK97 family phage prohead protease n=1 Tax=Marinifilum fragile TaxID=570161 RepID=UPI002AAB7861|nr:HK97 family phage prohead protease [Marinifilum fragile]
MIIEHEEVKNLLDEFNDLISNSQNIAIFTRDIELQKEEKNTLHTFIEKAESLRKAENSNYSEPELNLILCLEISAEAIQSELSMLINLKEGNMDAAWGNLVYAQNQTSIVASNHPFSNGDYLNGYLARLDAYEKVIFPKMMFASTGGIIRETKCSICKGDYEECDHMKGKMYNGQLCVREIHKIDLEEVSIVENPANKLCRVLTIERNGKMVDTLTLKGKTTGNNV